MNIVQALNKIKNDILSFVTLNLDTKADKDHEHKIDVAFSEDSTNPIQNRIVSAEISKLNGLVGDESVVTQIDTAVSLKQDTITGAATSITTDNLLAESVLVSDSDGKVAASLITASELNCLDGITSNVQTQLLSKASNAHTHKVDEALDVESTDPVQNKVVTEAINNLNELVGDEAVATQIETAMATKQDTITGAATSITSSNLTANRALISNGSGKVAISDVTSTELGYLDGVTSAIQTQLNGKSNTSHTHNYAGSSTAGGAATKAIADESGNEIDRFYDAKIPTGTSITSNSNLNTTAFLKVGNYYCTSNATAATLTNCPTSGAFMMNVYSPISKTVDDETTDTYVYRIRKILTYNGAEYIQSVSSSSAAGTFTYGDWELNYNSSDIIPVENGGTGHDFSNAPAGAIIRNSSDDTGLWYTATANGALYATGSNTNPKFGTLPIAQGGTGATTAANALKNLGVTATAAELNYVDGVTSNIQMQFRDVELAMTAQNGRIVALEDGKMSKDDPVGTGSISMNRKADTDVGQYSVAMGRDNTAHGICSVAIGHGNVSSARGALATGYNNIASGEYSVATGYSNTASGKYSVAMGYNSSASGDYSVALGNTVDASGSDSAAFGSGATASGFCSTALGFETVADKNYQTVVGMLNVPSSDGYFIVGDGSGEGKSNAFRVTMFNVYGGTYNSSGADYAEYFEWSDGNTNGEDRIGRFVTIVDGDKIKIAEPNEEILGVVSGNGSVVGDAHDDQWHGIWMRDIYGRALYEDVEVEYKDADGNITTVIEHRAILNPNYDNTKKYIPRSDRNEWDAVGMLGKLVLIDDGSCIPGGRCTCGNGGIAVASNEGYRVLERLDDNHVKVLIK